MWVAIIVLIIFLCFVRIVQINEYQRGVLFEFGKFSRILGPGWHFYIPLFANCRKVDIRTKTVDVPEQEAITKDNVSVKINAVLYYKIFDAKNAIIAVNTSCISITKIAALTNMEKNILGMHFMNPVYLKDCVEVIRGYHTSDKTIDTALSFLNEIGKHGVVVNDLPGFVSNRISHLFMNEAVFTLQDSVADAKKIDTIFKECFGHHMGPLETADLIGLDTVYNSLIILYNSYKDPKYRPAPLLEKMVNAGLLGVKTKKGFYEYN